MRSSKEKVATSEAPLEVRDDLELPVPLGLLVDAEDLVPLDLESECR